MKTNFYVGQKVRIRSYEDMKAEYGEFKDEHTGIDVIEIGNFDFLGPMKDLCGKACKIKEIHDDGEVVLYKWKGCPDLDTFWVFSIDMIEPVENNFKWYFSDVVRFLMLTLKIALRAVILFCCVNYMAIGMKALIGGDFVTAIFTTLLSLCFLAGDSIVDYLFERGKKL